MSDSYGTEDMLLGELEGQAEEEEAQMLLAIQRSLDSTWNKDEELERATALSLHSFQEEQRAGPGPASEEEDAGLLAALEASLEEALPAADTARVTLYASFEQDVSALPRQLEQALEARLRTEQVESAGLRALPAGCRRCLALLQRRHAVRLCLRDSTATLRGFAGYTAAAARDLAVLLQRLRPAERGPPGAAARWVRWDPTGTAVPYEPATAALLEAAWQRRERHLDVLLDGRPVIVDLEQMEEYDISTASALPISRSEPPSESAWHLLGACRGRTGVPHRQGLPPPHRCRVCSAGPEASGLDEEVRLMPLAEDSEEFGDTVQLFYATLEELYNKIHIVKVGSPRGGAGLGSGAGSWWGSRGVGATGPERCALSAGGEADPPAALQAVPAEEGQHGEGVPEPGRGAGPLPRHHGAVQPRDLPARLQPQLLRQER